MNRILIFFTGLAMVVMISAAFSQIPNSGFEQWAAGNPVGWATPNSPGFFVPITQSTDAHSGTYAVKGQVVNFVGLAISPSLVSGDSLGGFSFNQRPAALQGYYKYSPVGGDLFFATAIFYSQGMGIAFGEILISNTATGYTQFTVNLDYFSNDLPDTCYLHILYCRYSHG